jgi:hypothetical protein
MPVTCLTTLVISDIAVARAGEEDYCIKDNVGLIVFVGAPAVGPTG